MARKIEVIAAILVIAAIILLGVVFYPVLDQRSDAPKPTYQYTTETTQPTPIEQTIEVTLPDTGGPRL